jgi:hypothetical protein
MQALRGVHHGELCNHNLHIRNIQRSSPSQSKIERWRDSACVREWAMRCQSDWQTVENERATWKIAGETESCVIERSGRGEDIAARAVETGHRGTIAEAEMFLDTALLAPFPDTDGPAPLVPTFDSASISLASTMGPAT